MKILVGVSSHGPNKNYVHEKFYENMVTCVADFANVVTFGDTPIKDLEHVDLPPVHTMWQDDMTYQSRDVQLHYAEWNDYDALIWQGVDCLYKSKSDFARFIAGAQRGSYDAVGALTAGRNRPDYPIARRYTIVGDSITPNEISHTELYGGRTIYAGFPGADALFIKKQLFGITFDSLNYTPWYTKPDGGLCVEEVWCAEAIKRGFKIGLDCGVKTWHVHENGMASAWPGEYVNQQELNFVIS